MQHSFSRLAQKWLSDDLPLKLLALWGMHTSSRHWSLSARVCMAGCYNAQMLRMTA